MIILVRTTVNLPDEIYEVVRSIALARRVSFGEALAGLVRDGLNPVPPIETDSPFPHFSVGKDAPPITLEHTLEIEDEP